MHHQLLCSKDDKEEFGNALVDVITNRKTVIIDDLKAHKLEVIGQDMSRLLDVLMTEIGMKGEKNSQTYSPTYERPIRDRKWTISERKVEPYDHTLQVGWKVNIDN
jgi:hypothetical protein